MSTLDPPTFEDALAVVRRLKPRDRARLIVRLAEELARESASAPANTAPFALPVLTGGTWIDDLPLDRTSLYVVHQPPGDS